MSRSGTRTSTDGHGQARTGAAKPYRMVNGRPVWSEMPEGEWFVEDSYACRVLFVGRGIGVDCWMVLYRKGGALGRVMSRGSHRVRSKFLPASGDRDVVTRLFWEWACGRQCPMFIIRRGTLPAGQCVPVVCEEG